MNPRLARVASLTWSMVRGGATFLGALFFAAIPFLAPLMPFAMHLPYSFPTIPVLCGVAGGALYGFIALPASVVTYFVVMALITQTSFYLRNDDLSYLAVLLITIAYCLSAALTVLFLHVRRWWVERAAVQPPNDPGDGR